METVHPLKVQIALVQTVPHDDIMCVELKAVDLKDIGASRALPAIIEFPQPLGLDTSSRLGVIPHDDDSHQFWGTFRERIGEGFRFVYVDAVLIK